MSVKYKDYYDILGVNRSSTQEDIQKSYRRLARKYHPDINKARDAEDKFKEIGEAYEVLKDPKKRKAYDALGSNWKSGQDFTPPHGFEDIFSSFNRTAGRGGKAPGGGYAYTYSTENIGDLSDFFQMLFGGGGFAGGAAPFGKGQAFEDGDMFSHDFQQRAPRQRSTQAENLETEMTISLEDAYAGATKHITLQSSEGGFPGFSKRKSKDYQVKIPKGTTDGTVIRLTGQGVRSSAGAAGDLLLKINISPHPRFKTEGHNLNAILPITPWEAALGASVNFQTMDGAVKLKIPAGSQSGQTLRLRGKGLPKKGAKEYGDLHIELKIVVPEHLSAEEHTLFEKLKEKSRFSPR